MAAPSTSVLDTFGGTLSGWTNPAWNLGSSLSISGGQAVGVSSAQSGMAWSSAFTAGNLECYVTLPTTPPGGGSEATLWLASATTDAHRYGVTFGSLTAYTIRRWSDDYTASTLESGTWSGATGDKIGFQRIGDALNLWHYTSGAWTQLDTVDDSTYYDTAYVGLGDYNGVYAYDDFGGGVPAGEPPSTATLIVQQSGLRW